MTYIQKIASFSFFIVFAAVNFSCSTTSKVHEWHPFDNQIDRLQSYGSLQYARFDSPPQAGAIWPVGQSFEESVKNNCAIFYFSEAERRCFFKELGPNSIVIAVEGLGNWFRSATAADQGECTLGEFELPWTSGGYLMYTVQLDQSKFPAMIVPNRNLAKLGRSYAAEAGIMVYDEESLQQLRNRMNGNGMGTSTAVYPWHLP